jgi:bifunctional DNA-binding transcriptional regulator/antitoxin component of YhaV-PrlF toxin-antitoxin module
MGGSAGKRVVHRQAVLDEVAGRWPLPEPHLASAPVHESIAAPSTCGLHCVVTTTDRAGRLADRSLVRSLGWARHTLVRFDVRGDVTVVVPDASSTSSITTQGHLRLPLAVRRRSRIGAGTRVLVVAWPENDSLVLCTPDVIHEMLLGRTLGIGVHRGSPQ